MLVLVFPNQNNDSKRFLTSKYYLPKGIIKNYNVIINGKDFYNQSIDSDTKRYNEIRKLTTGQDEYFTSGCLLDYDCIKNHANVKTMGNTPEFLFGIYWWTWKRTVKKANKKCKNFNIFDVFFKKNKEKHQVILKMWY